MNILAVDTSTAVISVAITDEDKVIAEYSINNLKMHSQKIMVLIDEVLNSCRMTVADIDCFAAATGPGSFTGLRIGISTIKGLGYAANKQVVGISTLDGIAANVFSLCGLICPVIDARNEQVYTAAYKYNEKDRVPICAFDYMAVSVSDLCDMLDKTGERVIMTGDACRAYGNKFLQTLGNKCLIAPPHLHLCHASSIASLAWTKATNGETQNADSLLPFYIRQSQAERKSSCE